MLQRLNASVPTIKFYHLAKDIMPKGNEELNDLILYSGHKQTIILRQPDISQLYQDKTSRDRELVLNLYNGEKFNQ